MTSLEIRPLSLGELLDRSFSLYRDNFGLFVGIAIFPHLITLVWHFAELPLLTVPSIRARALGQPQPLEPGIFLLVGLLASTVESFFVYLFIQAPTTYAVAEIYLGHSVSAGAALRQMFTKIWRLAGCVLLTGMTLLVATLLLLVPGIALSGRLIAALPAAMIEDLTPGKAFKRSFSLTRDYSGRALVIYLLYLVLRLAAFMLLLYPQRIANIFVRQHAGTGAGWLALLAFGYVSAATLVGPVLAIAASVYYFDLRVRKEALDLQLMMNTEDGLLPRAK